MADLADLADKTSGNRELRFYRATQEFQKHAHAFIRRQKPSHERFIPRNGPSAIRTDCPLQAGDRW